VPAVELIRQTRSLPALRLMVELYAVQFLPTYGGVPRELLRGEFDRAKVGEQGPFVVWGFRWKHKTAHQKLAGPFLTGRLEKREGGGGRIDTGWHDVFWPALQTLEDLGLLERVGMLLDSAGDDAEIIHSYGFRGGEPPERELADAAESSARAMVTEGQYEWAQAQGYYYLVPARKHIANATLEEIFG
jgi:hypothetical protein